MTLSPSSRALLALAVASITLVSWTGCQSITSPSPGSQTAEQKLAVRNALVGALKFGMSKSQVQSWLGEPHTNIPSLPQEPGEEQWVYENRLPPRYKTIAIEIEEVPWVDPITGEMFLLREPLTGQQRIEGTEILTLTFRDLSLIHI